MTMPTPSLKAAAPLPGPLALMVAVALASAAGWAGLALSGGTVTTASAIALLVFGLPHGTLDLELVRKQRSGPFAALAPLLALYMGLAAAMLGLWLVEPVLALAAFIAIAVVHFSEDWDGTGAFILSAGIALCVLAAPSLRHGPELDAIFVSLTDSPSASMIAQALSAVAPFSLAIAAVAILVLWRRGHHDQAIGAVAAIAGMIMLPPIVGFAAFFCLFHSPRHFQHSLRDLNWRGIGAWGWVVVPLTFAAGMLAIAIFALEARSALSVQVMTASFMTLSILTVPHMLVPLIVALPGIRAGTQPET